MEKFITDFDAFLSRFEAEAENPAAASENHRQIHRLFYHLWFQDRLSGEGLRFLRKFLASPTIISAYKSFIVTAVTLSLQRYFDEQKFTLLFDAYEADESAIKQRALVGLLISLYRITSYNVCYTKLLRYLLHRNHRHH